MHDLPRQKLCEIIAQYNVSILNDARRCEGLLRDLCGGYKREISVLISALRARVPQELSNSSCGITREVVIARLSKRLHDDLAITEDAARWAVESWALALEVITTNVNEYDGYRTTASVNSSSEQDVSNSEYYHRVWSYIENGEFDRVVAENSNAIELNPDFADAYFNRGYAYYCKGEHDKAISDYTRAIEINPHDLSAYFERGGVYINKGENDKAISDCTKAIELNPTFADAYNRRGWAYSYKGEYDKAISDCTKAIELDPTFADAYSNRGHAYFNKGESDKANADFGKANQIERDIFELHLKNKNDSSAE